MEAVLGLRDSSPRPTAGKACDAAGCDAPHLAQYESTGPTWFPHWLQNGIHYSIRKPRSVGSGTYPRARHANIFAMKLLFNAVLSVLFVAGLLPAAKNLEVYFIDVEG